MSTRLICCTLLVLFCTSFSIFAQNLSAEEEMVLKTVKDEFAALYARDFDKYASHWVQKPYVNALFGGPGYYTHAEGWESLAKWSKSFFNNSRPLPAPTNYENVNIHVNGNMATVRFDLDGSMLLRVLEKENGTWKLIQAAGIGRREYDSEKMTNHFFENTINQLEGEWELDEESVKIEGFPWKIVNGEANLKRTGEKLSIKIGFSWKTPQEAFIDAETTFDIVPDPVTQKAQVIYSSAIKNGWAYVSAGLFSISMEGGMKLSGKLTHIAEESPWATILIDYTESGRIHYAVQWLNKGDNGWKMSYDLVKD